MVEQPNPNPNPIQIQRYLGGIDYPAGKDEVIAAARDAGADEGVLRVLDLLPDRQYEAPTDVSREATEGAGAEGAIEGA